MPVPRVRFTARQKAAVSAILLWAALNVFAAVPFLLDPVAIGNILPIYLGGVILLLEPLFLFWALYRFGYLLRSADAPDPPEPE